MLFLRSTVLCLLAASASAFAPLSSHHRSHQQVALSSTSTSYDFDLNTYIGERLPSIEQALDESLVSNLPQTARIIESMKYSLMAGGKRIRPVLCLAAAEMFAADQSPEAKAAARQAAMPAAVAIEMIHTMSLIHDDLPALDNDDLRRGVPTNHVVYGEDVAILAGDALLAQSFLHVANECGRLQQDPTRTLDVITRLGNAFGPQGLAGGQMMDLECEGKPVGEVSLEDLRWIHTHKTAVLLQVSVACGAILAGASPQDVAKCEQFALNVGLAFQVADDILDVTQSTEELGKTAGKDEDTDKTTYPRLLGLDGARAEAERLITLAKGQLDGYDSDRTQPLLALADFIINRKN